ncbi:MAG: hypothetical protein FWD58_05385 [Firmicutes bacterium]|nr:hypothetical protein [Bacillota bacterium]
MVKTLFDGTEVSNDCLDEFKCACSELVEAKYILAEKKIGAVLQIIAQSKRLYALIADCMEGFNFSTELASAKQFDKNGVPILILPNQQKDNVAFVFCLLLSFDTGQTDFKRFLHTFYCSLESANAEFSDFASAVVVPFCDDVVNLYIESVGEELKRQISQMPPEVARAPQEAFKASTPAYPPDGGAAFYPAPAPSPPPAASPARSVGAGGVDGDEAVDLAALSLITCAKEVIGITARDPSMGVKEREELLLICEAFIQAVRFGAEKPIRTMYIALKNTIHCSSIARKLQTQAVDLARVMDD